MIQSMVCSLLLLPVRHDCITFWTTSHLICEVKLQLYLKLIHISLSEILRRAFSSAPNWTLQLPVDSLHVRIFIILWNWKFLESREKLVFLHRILSIVCNWDNSCVRSNVVEQRLLKSSVYLMDFWPGLWSLLLLLIIDYGPVNKVPNDSRLAWGKLIKCHICWDRTMLLRAIKTATKGCEN